MKKTGNIFWIFLWILSSWFLVHLYAFLGVFLAVAFPIWWLLSPKQTTCFLCRYKKEGEVCHFCHRAVDKNGDNTPRNLFSAVCNGGVIFAFSLISMGVVYGESRVLFRLGFPPTPKTVDFSIPMKGQFRIGEIFPMKIEIVGISKPINTVQADLSFDASKLEVVDISTEGSFANIFIQKEINNEGGFARLTGGLPNPGFFSDRGIFGTVYFKGKTPGVVKIDFLPTSMVLANDERGTNVLKDLASVAYLVLPEKILLEEEETQNQMFFQTNVLGATTENTQMKFYEETKVLGAMTDRVASNSEKVGIGWYFANGLEMVDRFILSIWGKMALVLR